MVSRPNQPFPQTAGTAKPSTPKVLPDPTLDPIAFEALIRNRGVRFHVYHRMPCPNVNNIEENQHEANCPLCSNGFFYYDRGVAIGVFTSNSLRTNWQVDGQWQIGKAAVTMYAYSDNENGEIALGDPVVLDAMDKLIVLDYVFKHSELIEHSFSTLIDRLRYPALKVEKLVTKHAEYKQGVDFAINKDGNIEWNGKNHPDRTETLTERNDNYGEVYSITYLARPVYYVTHVIHEVRATTGWNAQLGRKEAIRLPQQVEITRDYLIDGPNDNRGEKFGRFPRSGASVIPG